MSNARSEMDLARAEVIAAENEVKEVKALLIAIASSPSSKTPNSVTIRALSSNLPDASFRLQVSSPVEEATISKLHDPLDGDAEGSRVVFLGVETGMAFLTVEARVGGKEVGVSEGCEMAKLCEFEAMAPRKRMTEIDVEIVRDPNYLASDSVEKNFVVDDKKDVVEEVKEVDDKKDVVEEKKDVVQEKKDVIEEKKDVVEEKEDAVEEKQDIVEEKKDAVEESKDAVEEKKDVVEEKTDLVEESKDVVEESKDVVEEKNDVVEEKKDVVESEVSDVTEKESDAKEESPSEEVGKEESKKEVDETKAGEKSTVVKEEKIEEAEKVEQIKEEKAKEEQNKVEKPKEEQIKEGAEPTKLTVRLRVEYSPSMNDQREELYQVLNEATKKKANAIERLRSSAMTVGRTKELAVKSSSAVKAGFLNKKSKIKEVGLARRWYEKIAGSKSMLRLAFPLAKNYLLFFGVVGLMHFKGHELALPAPL